MIIKKRNENLNKKPVNEELKVEKPVVEEKVDLFDLDNIEFPQRQERRRGNRRRGYRRIDDRNLISRAQEEAGTIRDNAAKEGFKAGIEKAQTDIELVKTSIKDFLKAKQEIFEYIAPDILEISIEIARKIVKKEIEQDPQLILGTILDVLKTISKDESKLTIKVNPSQLTIARENISEIKTSIGMEAKTNIVPDEAVDAGGCIVQTNNGVVDATINTQLEIIQEAFKGM